MDEMQGRVVSVIECKNLACARKITREGFPDEWPDEHIPDFRIHSDWNDELTAFCVLCVSCGHYTGNKIQRIKKKF